MKRVPSFSYYTCKYCGYGDVPLIQLGDEATDMDAEKRVSPEDSDNVEICESCLKKALLLFNSKPLIY